MNQGSFEKPLPSECNEILPQEIIFPDTPPSGPEQDFNSPFGEGPSPLENNHPKNAILREKSKFLEINHEDSLKRKVSRLLVAFES